MSFQLFCFQYENLIKLDLTLFKKLEIILCEALARIAEKTRISHLRPLRKNRCVVRTTF